MGVLLLVRHGQASLGTADYDRLSDVGRRQAQVTGDRLVRTDLAIDRVVCGGLSHTAFIDRVLAAVGHLVAEPGGTVAVTSGGVIAAFCAQALGLPEERWPSLARLLVNASITKVISGHTGTSLVTFNDHAHLEIDRSLITYR